MFKVYQKKETKLNLVKIDNVIREWFVKTVQLIGGEIRYAGPIGAVPGISYYSATINATTHNVIAKMENGSYLIFAADIDTTNNKITRMKDSIHFAECCVVVSSALATEFEDDIISMIYDAFISDHPDTPDMDFYKKTV